MPLDQVSAGSAAPERSVDRCTSELTAWNKRTIKSAFWVMLFALWVAWIRAPQMSLFLVQSQDLPVLVLVSLSALLATAYRPDWRLPSRWPSGWALLLVGAGLSALLAWGTYALMANFPLSRDEHMVAFDMAVFDKARLAAPLAPAWRAYGAALVPNFLLNSNQPIGLVSTYLPMNALLRLGFSKLADPAWLNPLLALAGGAALLAIARRIFGPRDRACWVVLLVYGLSAQMLVTAMTSYSMTAHMALNLVWLAAFLRGGKAGHAVALGTGFVAIGLHQLVFHPVFAAPFLLWRLREGHSRIALAYVAAYAAFILWWAYYPILVSPLVAQAGQASDGNIVTQKIIPLLLYRDPRTVGLTTLNLLRFIAWQNLALIPLLAAAVPLIRRERGFPGALLLGIVSWLAFVTFVLPDQGRGWGYRYLHPYLGSFALLAGFGYRELERHIGRRADGLVILLSGVTAFAALPLLFMATYRFMEPHLAIERLIVRQQTPFVVIDDNPSKSLDGRWADNALDHVRNSPDLDNRPLRFSAEDLTPSLLAELCQRGAVTLITRADMHRLGFIANVSAQDPKFEALVGAVQGRAPGCFRSAEGFPS